jgi:hypothetical protein
MEDSSIFRAKVEPTVEVVQPKGEPTQQIHTSEYSEPPLGDGPYLPELWEMGEAKEHFEMPSLIKEINEFVLSEIERNKMESNRKSYKEIIDNYEKKLGLPEGIDIYARTEKILSLMKIDMKLLQAVKEKEELLSKPITELTSRQLRQRIENAI